MIGKFVRLMGMVGAIGLCPQVVEATTRDRFYPLSIWGGAALVIWLFSIPIIMELGGGGAKPKDGEKPRSEINTALTLGAIYFLMALGLGALTHGLSTGAEFAMIATGFYGMVRGGELLLSVPPRLLKAKCPSNKGGVGTFLLIFTAMMGYFVWGALSYYPYKVRERNDLKDFATCQLIMGKYATKTTGKVVYPQLKIGEKVDWKSRLGIENAGDQFEFLHRTFQGADRFLRHPRAELEYSNQGFIARIRPNYPSFPWNYIYTPLAFEVEPKGVLIWRKSHSPDHLGRKQPKEQWVKLHLVEETVEELWGFRNRSSVPGKKKKN